MDSSPDGAETRETVRTSLADAFGLIQTPDQAEAVLARLEDAARSSTEEDQAEQSARQQGDPGQRIQRPTRAGRRPSTERTAAALMSAAAESVAPTPSARDVVEGAREAAGTREPSARAVESQRVQVGRKHLKDAALRRMAPLQALDARIFLALNQQPHPRWLDRVANWLALTSKGGWLWGIAVAAAGIAGAPRPKSLLILLAATETVTAVLVEYPIKAAFRRRRPFIDVVRALVVGKEPGSWSFPSGHTATAFAAAVIVESRWRSAGPTAYALAAITGLSRIYVGVHYPGDVLSGATIGLLAGWTFRLLAWMPARIRTRR